MPNIPRAPTILEQAMTLERPTANRAPRAAVEASSPANHFDAELLGTVSHELRSPLAAIKGYAATLRRHEEHLSSAERREFLEAIDTASDRLALIVDRLLTLSQLEAGTLPLEWSTVDLVRLAEMSIAVAEQNLLREGGSRHTFTLVTLDAEGREGTGPALARGDERSLRQLVDNLLENAVKYSPAGGAVEIAVRIPPPEEGGRIVSDGEGHGASTALAPPIDQSRLDAAASAAAGPDRPPPRFCELVVSDSGIGIPSEHLSRIFETFHRVDMGLTREVDGLGLGLALCRRIVDLHHGAIWADSSPGSGSAFHVLLPAADGEEFSA